MLNSGGSPGHVFGAIGPQLHAVVLNGFVRQRLRRLPDKATPEELRALAEFLEAGKLNPVVDRTYPLTGTAEALRQVEQGHVRGKLVVTVP